MTYSLISKEQLPCGKILHSVKYNDTKNYCFQFDTEQDQSALDAAVDVEVKREEDEAKQLQEIEDQDKEVQKKLAEIEAESEE